MTDFSYNPDQEGDRPETQQRPRSVAGELLALIIMGCLAVIAFSIAVKALKWGLGS